jgi:hypothetical protein
MTKEHIDNIILTPDLARPVALIDWDMGSRGDPLIDLATLTGSQVTALGDEYAGLFTRHDDLAAQLQAAGAASGEEVWRLPLHPSYAKDLESPIADLRNGGSSSRAGAGVGAFFIGAWVAPELASQLGAGPGSRLKIGDVFYTVTDIVDDDPAASAAGLADLDLGTQRDPQFLFQKHHLHLR